MVRNLLIVMLLFACSGWASTATLVPNADVTIQWQTFGATGCASGGMPQANCIDNGVDTPNDSEGAEEDSSDRNGAGLVDTFDLSNSPGDYSSTNSVTARVRTACFTGCTADDLDNYTAAFTTSGGTDSFTVAINGSPNCTLTGTTISNCSFTLTTANWDTSGEIDGATITFTFADNNSGMPDTMGYQIIEVEIDLDYNVAGAAPTIKKRMIIFGLGPQPARKEDARLG